MRPETERKIAAFVRNYLPAISAIGVVLYGLFRLSYVFFYVRLRTTPEEVGYTYTRIIAESIVGAIELVVICTAIIAAVTAATFPARIAVFALIRRRRLGWADLLRGVSRRVLVRIVNWSLVGATSAVIVSLPFLAWWQGGLAQAGQTVRNVYFIGVPYLPVLAVQAVPADVSWVDGDSEKAVPLKTRRCLLYLGKAEEVAVFFDVANRESLRLPLGDITVSLRYTYFVPEACRHKWDT
jgi:hypothetical protein